MNNIILQVCTTTTSKWQPPQSLVTKCYVSTGRKYEPNNELCYDIPLIGSALYLEIHFSTYLEKYFVGSKNGRAPGRQLQQTKSSLGQESNLHLTANRHLIISKLHLKMCDYGTSDLILTSWTLQKINSQLVSFPCYKQSHSHAPCRFFSSSDLCGIESKAFFMSKKTAQTS